MNKCKDLIVRLGKAFSRVPIVYHNWRCRHHRCVRCNLPFLVKGGDHYRIDAGYFFLGKNFERNCERAQLINRRDSSVDMCELSDAHTLLVGIIGSMLEEHNGRRVPVEDENIRRKFVLTAAFVQGIFLCEQSILRSMYLQAGALIRQEFETLVLLNEIKAGRRKDGKVGNAKHAPWKSSRHYGELSAFAHLSNHQILDSIIGYNTTWGDFAATTPRYQKENAKRIYCWHISLVLGIVEELAALYVEMYAYKPSERETDAKNIAFSILVKYKVFKEPRDKSR